LTEFWNTTAIIPYLCELINNNLYMNQKLKVLSQILVALVIFAAIVGTSSCEKFLIMPPVKNPDDTLGVDTVHFKTDIQPIFNANCNKCHGAIQKPILKEGKAYQNLSAGGYIIPPGKTSRLYVHMTNSGHTARSNEPEKQKVLNWVDQGALDN
jgi:hypothetical protein